MTNPFDAPTRGALQRSVVSQPHARELFIRGLGRISQGTSVREGEHEQGRRGEWEQAQLSQRQGFGHLSPTARPQRYKAEHPTDYMLRAILHDNAVATYDRQVQLNKIFAKDDVPWPSATF